MEKMLTDVHTHSTFSHDGRSTLAEMLAAAHKKGICFYGVSEHYDYDVYVATKLRTWTNANCDGYIHTARRLQEDYAGAMNVLVGYEFGFTDEEVGKNEYRSVYEKYQPDFVVNSIHTWKGDDYYGGKPYLDADGNARDKDEVYAEYLALVRRSLDAPYHYDIVGHIGYVTRYAPHADKRLYLEKHAAVIDDILQTIIAKDKILEINSSNKGGTSPCLPQRDIVERYYALGGRRVSFASDAHATDRIADGREGIVAMLREIGFTHLTVPCRGEYIEVEI